MRGEGGEGRWSGSSNLPTNNSNMHVTSHYWGIKLNEIVIEIWFGLVYSNFEMCSWPNPPLHAVLKTGLI